MKRIYITEGQLRKIALHKIISEEGDRVIDRVNMLNSVSSFLGGDDEAIGTTSGKTDNAVSGYTSGVTSGSTAGLPPVMSWPRQACGYVFQMFTGPLFKGVYNQGETAGASQLRQLGLRAKSSRADCSGFVCTALAQNGKDIGLKDTNALFAGEIPGFKKIRWGKPATDAYTNGVVPPGTIFVRRNNGKGHTTIYAGPSADGNGLCWDFGGNRRNTQGSPISGKGRLTRKYGIAFVPV